MKKTLITVTLCLVAGVSHAVEFRDIDLIKVVGVGDDVEINYESLEEAREKLQELSQKFVPGTNVLYSELDSVGRMLENAIIENTRLKMNKVRDMSQKEFEKSGLIFRRHLADVGYRDKYNRVQKQFVYVFAAQMPPTYSNTDFKKRDADDVDKHIAHLKAGALHVEDALWRNTSYGFFTDEQNAAYKAYVNDMYRSDSRVIDKIESLSDFEMEFEGAAKARLSELKEGLAADKYYIENGLILPRI